MGLHNLYNLLQEQIVKNGAGVGEGKVCVTRVLTENEGKSWVVKSLNCSSNTTK